MAAWINNPPPPIFFHPEPQRETAIYVTVCYGMVHAPLNTNLRKAYPVSLVRNLIGKHFVETVNSREKIPYAMANAKCGKFMCKLLSFPEDNRPHITRNMKHIWGATLPDNLCLKSCGLTASGDFRIGIKMQSGGEDTKMQYLRAQTENLHSD